MLEFPCGLHIHVITLPYLFKEEEKSSGVRLEARERRFLQALEVWNIESLSHAKRDRRVNRKGKEKESLSPMLAFGKQLEIVIMSKRPPPTVHFSLVQNVQEDMCRHFIAVFPLFIIFLIIIIKKDPNPVAKLPAKIKYVRKY